MYIPTKVTIPKNQHDKLKNAVKDKKAVSVLFKSNTGKGKQTILLTTLQKHKLERSALIGKENVCIKLSAKQIEANLKHSGGFLSVLAGLAARALPTLLGGLATGLISGGIERAIAGSAKSGNGLYLHKSGHCVKVKPISGNGLQLLRRKKPAGIFGDGLFLKKGSKIYDGKGLLLGPNSPFKKIPILGLIL